MKLYREENDTDRSVSLSMILSDAERERPNFAGDPLPTGVGSGGMQGIWHPNYLCGDLLPPLQN